MLTPRQNLLETIRGGHPDRFVICEEYYKAFLAPNGQTFGTLVPGNVSKDRWGVTWDWTHLPLGPIPLHGEYTVLKDVTKWRDVIKMPSVEASQEAWDAFSQQCAAVDRDKYFCQTMIFPGVFETLHCLMGMENCLCSFYEEPEAMHELIDFIADYQIAAANEICAHADIDMLDQADDWGTRISTFLSPEMHREFIVPAYKKIYPAWRANGVELIRHHSDTYAETLVPMFIELGVDIWQGCTTTNDIAGLIEKYGGQIAFQGGIESSILDVDDWTPEMVEKEVRMALEKYGKYKSSYIPGLTGINSLHPGMDECVYEMVEKIGREMF